MNIWWKSMLGTLALVSGVGYAANPFEAFSGIYEVVHADCEKTDQWCQGMKELRIQKSPVSSEEMVLTEVSGGSRMFIGLKNWFEAGPQGGATIQVSKESRDRSSYQYEGYTKNPYFPASHPRDTFLEKRTLENSGGSTIYRYSNIVRLNGKADVQLGRTLALKIK